MFMLKQGEIKHVQYTKATNYGSSQQGEVSDRYVIPTFVPHDNIKVLDVSGYSPEEQQRVQDLYQQYMEYYNRAISTLFSFEDWIEHTGTDGSGLFDRDLVRWRTFKLPNITELD